MICVGPLWGDDHLIRKPVLSKHKSDWTASIWDNIARAEVRSSFITTTHWVRLFGKNPRSHHKGSTGRVWTGDELLPVLCHCQLGQHIPTNKNLKIYAEQFPQKLVCLRGACFQPRFELPKSHFSWRLNLKEILTHNYFDCLFQAPQVLAPDFRKERVKIIMNKNLDWNWGGTKLIFIVSNANYFVATLCSLAAGGG